MRRSIAVVNWRELRHIVEGGFGAFIFFAVATLGLEITLRVIVLILFHELPEWTGLFAVMLRLLALALFSIGFFSEIANLRTLWWPTVSISEAGLSVDDTLLPWRSITMLKLRAFTLHVRTTQTQCRVYLGQDAGKVLEWIEASRPIDGFRTPPTIPVEVEHPLALNTSRVKNEFSMS